MIMTWILVANASEAHLYSSPKARLFNSHGNLREIGTYSHPESRQKNADIVSDRNGCRSGVHNGVSTTINAYTPKKLEADQFARELVDKLLQEHFAHRYQDLIIAAPPEFHGVLRRALQSKNLDNLVSVDINKDYTKLKSDALVKQLQGYL